MSAVMVDGYGASVLASCKSTEDVRPLVHAILKLFFPAPVDDPTTYHQQELVYVGLRPLQELLSEWRIFQRRILFSQLDAKIS